MIYPSNLGQPQLPRQRELTENHGRPANVYGKALDQPAPWVSRRVVAQRIKIRREHIENHLESMPGSHPGARFSVTPAGRPPNLSGQPLTSNAGSSTPALSSK